MVWHIYHQHNAAELNETLIMLLTELRNTIKQQEHQFKYENMLNY